MKPTTIAFAIVCVIAILALLELRVEQAQAYTKVCQAELTQAKTELAAVTSDNKSWEDENNDVWDELVQHREVIDRCREGVEICHEYCLCPWTLQPLPEGHDDSNTPSQYLD